MILRVRLGDRAFYKKVLTVAVPMMIQSGVTNLVSLLDNLMIGALGENAISGVAIGNQLIFVFFLLIFGAGAGVGIFSAQFYGKGDIAGVRYSFRFKLILNTILSCLSIGIFLLYSPFLISLFLKGEGSPDDAARILQIGTKYIYISLFGLIPVGITNAYSGTLRDTGETKIPMIASIIAIFVNLTGNAILIYGLFGFPAMGAAGAAVATVISRFVELAFLVIYTGYNSSRYKFIIGAFKSLYVPGYLVSRFILKSLPLMANETLWSLGMVVMNQCYSYRSLAAVAALNIESTIYNLLMVAFVAMGEAVGIIIGQMLGAGEIDRAKKEALMMRDFTVFCGLTCGIVLAALSPFFPLLYNVSDGVRHMATGFILIYGILMPFFAYTHASYFIIRAGGNTLITVLFDSCFVWLISVPLCFVLSHYTDMSVTRMILAVQCLEFIKCLVGYVMVRSGIWAKNIVKS